MSDSVRKPTVVRKPTLAVDFDGVIHAYSRGWQGGSIYDPPTPGCEAALRVLVRRWRLVVFTARDELLPVRVWLRDHGLHGFFAEVTNRKPPAVAYLDDRGVRWTSWQEALVQLGGVV